MASSNPPTKPVGAISARDIDLLLQRYEARLVEKRRILARMDNDMVEGIALVLEDIIKDLKALKRT
jgi:hypothetical protein